MRWCAKCERETEIIKGPICPKCGDLEPSGRLCKNCQTVLPQFEALRSWAVFRGPLRKAIHRLKYKRDVALGEQFSQALITCLDQLDWPVEMVIPVPLGVARLQLRGYNQASLMARPLALCKGLAFRPHALARVRETRSQVELSLHERKENVRDAFQAQPKIVYGKKILLVDDVATTGATLDQCAVSLIGAGASQVFGLTLARSAFSPPVHL